MKSNSLKKNEKLNKEETNNTNNLNIGYICEKLGIFSLFSNRYNESRQFLVAIVEKLKQNNLANFEKEQGVVAEEIQKEVQKLVNIYFEEKHPVGYILNYVPFAPHLLFFLNEHLSKIDCEKELYLKTLKAKLTEQLVSYVEGQILKCKKLTEEDKITTENLEVLHESVVNLIGQNFIALCEQHPSGEEIYIKMLTAGKSDPYVQKVLRQYKQYKNWLLKTNKESLNGKENKKIINEFDTKESKKANTENEETFIKEIEEKISSLLEELYDKNTLITKKLDLIEKIKVEISKEEIREFIKKINNDPDQDLYRSYTSNKKSKFFDNKLFFMLYDDILTKLPKELEELKQKIEEEEKNNQKSNSVKNEEISQNIDLINNEKNDNEKTKNEKNNVDEKIKKDHAGLINNFIFCVYYPTYNFFSKKEFVSKRKEILFKLEIYEDSDKEIADFYEKNKIESNVFDNEIFKIELPDAKLERKREARKKDANEEEKDATIAEMSLSQLKKQFNNIKQELLNMLQQMDKEKEIVEKKIKKLVDEVEKSCSNDKTTIKNIEELLENVDMYIKRFCPGELYQYPGCDKKQTSNECKQHFKNLRTKLQNKLKIKTTENMVNELVNSYSPERYKNFITHIKEEKKLNLAYYPDSLSTIFSFSNKWTADELDKKIKAKFADRFSQYIKMTAINDFSINKKKENNQKNSTEGVNKKDSTKVKVMGTTFKKD